MTLATARRVKYSAALQRCKFDAPLPAAGGLTSLGGLCEIKTLRLECGRWLLPVQSDVKEGIGMEEETRIAVIGIIVEDKKKVGEVNQLLHEYGEFIIGRMGLPYEKRGVNIISIVVDAPMDKISALSGKLGRLPGVGAKALYSGKAKKAENSEPKRGV